jgi:hypothetical protein
MRKKLLIGNINSAFRWLLLALLFTGVVAENFSEERSVYKIEEILADAHNRDFARNLSHLTYSHYARKKISNDCFGKKDDHKFLEFLSQKLQFKTELTIANAPDTLTLIMRATGHSLKSKSLASGDHFISHS